MGVYGRALRCILTLRLAVLESGERNFMLLWCLLEIIVCTVLACHSFKIKEGFRSFKNAFEAGLAMLTLEVYRTPSMFSAACTHFGQSRTIYFENKMYPSNPLLQNILESFLVVSRENFPYL